MNEPVGSLCVLRDGGSERWLVSICQGGARKMILRRYEAPEQASAFALEERGRRMQTDGRLLTVHFPDDCPCRGNG